MGIRRHQGSRACSRRLRADPRRGADRACTPRDVPLPPRPPDDPSPSGRKRARAGDARDALAATLSDLAGVHASGSDDERLADVLRDRPRLSVEPVHALIVMGALVIALATSLTLLVQQSANLASARDAQTSVRDASPSAPADAQSAPSSPSATADASSTPASTASAPDADGPIDLNAATQEQLESIKGIGPVTAAGIIEYRTGAGRFSSVDELLAVPGIGAKTLEKIRPHVRVGP